MAKTVLKKDRTVNVKTKTGGSYSYKFTTLAEIHKYLEETNQRYYAFIQRVDGEDYMFIQPLSPKEDAGGEVKYVQLEVAIQGARVIPSQNMQEYGGNLTSARRYSLLMAYGLACEDDDSPVRQSSPQTAPVRTGNGLDFDKIKAALSKAQTDEQVDAVKKAIVKQYPKLTEKQQAAINRMCADRKDHLEFGDNLPGWSDAKGATA